jgi:hypothetical protein
MTAQDRDWHAQDALRTLMAAEAIRRDPALMRNDSSGVRTRLISRRNLAIGACVGEGPKSTQGGGVSSLSRRSLSGDEDAFPRPRLSARCRFSQGTFAGTRGVRPRGASDAKAAAYIGQLE